MYITNLEASGLKGLSFIHDLQRCTLFTGPNFVGKSARLEAIRFGLLGSVPDLGKTNQATWDLSGGNEMHVRLSLDNGKDVERSLVKAGESVNKRGNAAACEFEASRMPMLDPEEYFGLTDSERIHYVFGMMKMPETFTRDGIFAEIRNLSLEENTEPTEKAKGEIIDLINREFSPGRPLTAALIDAIADLKLEFTAVNRRAKDTQGTLRVLSELKTRGAEATADTIQGVVAELRAVTEAWNVANQASGALTQRQMEANRVGLRRTQIQEALGVDTEDVQPKVDELLKAIAEANKKLKKLKAISTEKLHALEQAEEEAKQASENADEMSANTQARLEDATTRKAALGKLKCCPHCQSKAGGWKANLTAAIDAELANLQAETAQTDALVAAAVARWNKATAAFSKAKKPYEARQTLLDIVDASQRSLDAINARTAGATARRQALQSELASLKDVSAPTDAEMSEAASRVMTLKQQYADLSARHTTLVQLQQDLIRAGEAAEEHQLASAKVAVIKAVGAKLKERQAEMIAVLFGDLMKVANYFVSGIMEHALVFQDGRIGYVKQGRFVSHSTFSGTERALTYIAVTAALMREAPLRLVLLDEFDIDAEVFPKVLDRLGDAVVDGVIDQVVVAHTAEPSALQFRSAEWQHIPLVKAA